MFLRLYSHEKTDAEDGIDMDLTLIDDSNLEVREDF
jgi:hypothetical protein